MNSDLTVNNGDCSYESGEASEQTAGGEERSGREESSDQMLPPGPGGCADWQKATAEGWKRGRKEGRKGGRVKNRLVSEGGAEGVSQPMWQKVLVRSSRYLHPK